MSYLYKEFLVPQITRKATYQVLLIADSLTWRLVLKVVFLGNKRLNFYNFFHLLDVMNRICTVMFASKIGTCGKKF